MSRPKTGPSRPMEEALAEIPPPSKPTLTRQRVSNGVGSYVSGAQGRRRVMLLHRHAWRDLHNVDDLWTTALLRAPRLLLGVAEMVTAAPGLYAVTTATTADGYAAMLKSLISSVAREDGIRRVDYLGTSISPRRWGPQAGLRRRGAQSVRAVQRTHGIEDETMDQLMDQICGGFVARLVTYDDV